MNKKTKKIIRLALIGAGIFTLINISLIIYTMVDDGATSSKTSLDEYNNLFNKESYNKLQILATVKSRNRMPISTYVFDGKYNICVFKVTLLNNSKLSDIIHYENETSSKSLNATYADLPSFNFNMSIKAGKSVSVSILHFKSSGGTIKSVVSNDSLACYFYKFHTFSINYNNEPYDIIANAKDSNIPANVAFIKKGKILYIVLMTIARENGEMQPNQLYNLLTK